MTAADIQAVAECVTAVTAAGAVAAWILRTRRKVGEWRKRRQRDAILGVVVPMCAATLVLAVILASRDKGAS